MGKQKKALWYRAAHPNGVERKPRKRVPHTSRKTSSRMRAYRKAAAEWKVKNPKCAKCEGKTTHVHHKRGRLGPLLMDKRYWVPMCTKDHRWVHENPDAARELNLLCQPGEWGKYES